MNPIQAYQTLDVAYPFRLRGPGNSQNDTGLIWQPPGYRTTGRGAGLVTTGTERLPGLAIGFYELQNRSGSTGVVGLGVRVPNGLWIAGQWDDDGATPFSDDTTDAQDAGAADFALETTTGNDGFVIAARVPFNAVSVDVGTASVGGTPARAVRYTNSAGDGWTAFANLFVQDGASGNLAATGTTVANEYVIAWAMPTDWGKTASGGLSGIPQGLYAINVRATTAPTTTAAVADTLSIFRLYFLREAVTDNTVITQDFGAKDITMAWDKDEGLYGDALVALFETANNQNRVTVAVRSK